MCNRFKFFHALSARDSTIPHPKRATVRLSICKQFINCTKIATLFIVLVFMATPPIPPRPVSYVSSASGGQDQINGTVD